jgi:hypothetical protein
MTNEYLPSLRFQPPSPIGHGELFLDLIGVPELPSLAPPKEMRGSPREGTGSLLAEQMVASVPCGSRAFLLEDGTLLALWDLVIAQKAVRCPFFCPYLILSPPPHTSH